MAEGPQVLRRTQWLDKQLGGKRVLRCVSQREDIPSELLAGQRVLRVFCKGKNIFLEFANGQYLHNHLLMRGTWRRFPGALLFLPADAWLGLFVGDSTICNLRGQRLRLIEQAELERQLAGLGPDAMARPYPAAAIRASLLTSPLAISEALLQQSLVAGVGNIAKSEILFCSKLHPRIQAAELNPREIEQLLKAIRKVLWQSYQAGGRWSCQVYRRLGESCPRCHGPISSLSLPPSRRTSYFCARCQPIREGL